MQNVNLGTFFFLFIFFMICCALSSLHASTHSFSAFFKAFVSLLPFAASISFFVPDLQNNKKIITLTTVRYFSSERGACSIAVAYITYQSTWKRYEMFRNTPYGLQMNEWTNIFGAKLRKEFRIGYIIFGTFFGMTFGCSCSLRSQKSLKVRIQLLDMLDKYFDLCTRLSMMYI